MILRALLTYERHDRHGKRGAHMRFEYFSRIFACANIKDAYVINVPYIEYTYFEGSSHEFVFMQELIFLSRRETSCRIKNKNYVCAA